MGLIFVVDSTGLGDHCSHWFPLRNRIRLNQLLNNVRINRNTKFERLELLPIETVFFKFRAKLPLLLQKMAIAQPPSPRARHLHGHCENGFLYPFGNFGQALCFQSGHEDPILTGKSHNCAEIAFIQVAQS